MKPDRPLNPLNAFPAFAVQGGGLSSLRKAMKPVKPKQASAVAMKRAAKTIEGMGKTVAAIAVAPDGGFTLTIATPSDVDEGGYWDKVTQK